MATNSFIEFGLAEAQKLADYTSIAFDLRTACEFATFIVEETQNPQSHFALHDPFMVATVIRYARAFSGGVRLNLYNEGAYTLTAQQLAKHDYFIHIRDKYIAHSVNAFEESTPVARYWVERVHEEGITSIECNHSRVVGLSQHDLTDIIDLASAWLLYVNQQLAEEKARLLTIVRQIPLADLRRSSPGPLFPDTSQPQKRRVPPGT
jgi:hypothetical protein